MRLSKDLRKKAKERNNERALAKEMDAKATQWDEKRAAAAQRGCPIPPGGILYLTKELLFLHTVKEWVAVVSESLKIPYSHIQVTMNADKPDLNLSQLPGMAIAIPEGWLEDREIEVNSAKHEMMKGQIERHIKSTLDGFERAVRKRYEVFGYTTTDQDNAN